MTELKIEDSFSKLTEEVPSDREIARTKKTTLLFFKIWSGFYNGFLTIGHNFISRCIFKI